MDFFNPQDLANTAWAFAKSGQSDALLFGAFAMVAELCLGKFSEQNLRMTLWALSRWERLTDA